MKGWITTLLSALLIGFGLMLGAQEVPLDLQTKLTLKILGFDRNFDRYGDPIRIGVSSDALFTAFNSVKDTITVNNKKIIVEKMAGPGDASKYKVVYLDSSWAASYKVVAAASAEKKILMFSSEETGVVEGGAAVSFKLVENKPKIVLSINAAKTQGADFPATLLQMAVIVGNP